MSLSSSAAEVQQALDAIGMHLEVVCCPLQPAHPLKPLKLLAARWVSIAKSIVFQALTSQRPVLVIASGPNRVNEKSIAELIGEDIGKAEADFVRQRTGYVIGGVPPVGHTERLETFIDHDLLQYPEIWAAAGTPHAVFRLSPDQLLRMTCGLVIKVT